MGRWDGIDGLRPAIKNLTVAEAAKRLGVSSPRVRQYLKQDRLVGAFKVGEGKKAPWLIPKSAVDGFRRRKSGRVPKGG